MGKLPCYARSEFDSAKRAQFLAINPHYGAPGLAGSQFLHGESMDDSYKGLPCLTSNAMLGEKIQKFQCTEPRKKGLYMVVR